MTHGMYNQTQHDGHITIRYIYTHLCLVALNLNYEFNFYGPKDFSLHKYFFSLEIKVKVMSILIKYRIRTLNY